MPTVTTYKRLFEVRLLHEYYLLDASYPTFFDRTKTDRETILGQRILKNQYRLNKDLEIIPDEGTATLFKALNWRFVPTATGFVVAARTVLKAVGGNDIEFPYSPLPAPLPPLYFHIQAKNRAFKTYTFIPLRKKPLPLNYYFSNGPAAVHDADFAALSLPISPFVPANLYEMGDIAQIGADIQEAPTDTSSNLNWLAVDGKGWVNENDRICLSKTFRYQFPAGNTATSAVFTLKSADGAVVLKTVSKQGSNPLQSVALDFSFIKNADNEDVDTADGHYRLEVKVGSATSTHTLYLTDVFRLQAVGLIHINMAETDASYNIFNADGSLRNLNPNPLGERIHPVFELRLRSRKTYWRYVPTYNDDSFAVNASLANYLIADGPHNVITQRPQIFTYLPYGVLSSNDLDPPEAKLPAPRVPSFRPLSPDRLVTEIDTLPINGKID